MNIEEKMKDQNRQNFWRGMSVILFVAVMAAGFVLGLICFPLRPTESELEKRKLTEFPDFTAESFIDGQYCSDIDKWFADTYPFREQFLTAEQNIQTFYGVKTNAISASGDGDEIPDIDALLESMAEAESQSEAKEETTETAALDTTAASETEITEAETVASEEETPAEPETVAQIDGQEIAKMNPQEAGAVNILDLVGYCVYGFNLKAANKYCEDVAAVSTAFKDDPNVTIYDMLIPDNSAILLPEETKAAWKLSDETKVIQYYQGYLDTLDPEVVDVNIYDTLVEHNDEYLYFKTDHHWTQLGAYYAYREFCEAAGFTPHELDEYPTVDSGAFLGSYFTANGYTQLQDNPDDVISYQPIVTNRFSFMDDSLGQMREGNMVRDMSDSNIFTIHQKYLSYIYGDNSYSVAENPEIKNGRKCIVVKESFGNCWAPFLVDHYEKLMIVDYRTYSDSIVELAKAEGATDIIFINNLEAISDLWTMEERLGKICK